MLMDPVVSTTSTRRLFLESEFGRKYIDSLDHIDNLKVEIHILSPYGPKSECWTILYDANLTYIFTMFFQGILPWTSPQRPRSIAPSLKRQCTAIPLHLQREDERVESGERWNEAAVSGKESKEGEICKAK